MVKARMRRRDSRWALAVALAATWIAGAHAPALAEAPLLIEGKKTLYQKILTKPGASLAAEPAAAAKVVEAGLTPFNLFYVFERKNDAAGKSWLRVGRAVKGPSTGWLPAEKAVDWKQTIVVAFTNPAGRGRTLMFRSKQELMGVVQSDKMVATATSLREQAAKGTLPTNSPVISIEPETFVDISNQFYLLPILSAEVQRLPSRRTGKVLEVASIPLDVNPLSGKKTREEILRDFNVGILFAIDTTTSMGPYIQRTQKAVQALHEKISKSEIASRASFGLVGFRASTKLVPKLEYVTKTFQKLDRKAGADAFVKAIAKMEAAKISSGGFDEDSLAAVNAAITEPDWGEFGGRYVILVTDAGPRTDKTASIPNLNPKELSTLAQEKGVALFTLHLKTPQGKSNHDSAEGAYRALSRFGGQELYYPVPEGNVDAFESQVGKLAEALIGQVRQTVDGKLAEANASAKATGGVDGKANLVGMAMQLAYLGEKEGTKAPDVFNAWMLQHDLTDLDKAALDVRVFLTKNQLATLRDVAKAIVEKGETTSALLDPNAFFGQLRSAVAAIARSSDRVVNAEFESLGDALGEYLAGLPYQSKIMGITERDWVTMTGGPQREILDGLKAKIRLYEKIHDTPALWTALYPGTPEGEKVYAIPLDAMP